LLLAQSHFFPKLLQIEISSLSLGQHLGFFLTNVVPDTFRHDGELRRIAVVGGHHVPKFGHELLDHMVFLQRLIHLVLVLFIVVQRADSRIDDFLFQRGVYLELSDGRSNNGFFLQITFCLLKLIK
jgi:hypothetical protein